MKKLFILLCCISSVLVRNVLAQTSTVSTEEISQKDILEHWAPEFYQDVNHQSSYTDQYYVARDIPVAFNFDNDWNALNNWNNSRYQSDEQGKLHDRSTFPLYPVVYTAFIESQNFYFLTYVLYYSGQESNFGPHEHDAERVCLIVRKDGSTFGKLEHVRSSWHKSGLNYRANDYRFTDMTHPQVYSSSAGITTPKTIRDMVGLHDEEVHGHGLEKHPGQDDADRNAAIGDDAVVLTVADYNDNVVEYHIPGSNNWGNAIRYHYKLVPIHELWNRRGDPNVFTPAKYSQFQGDTSSGPADDIASPGFGNQYFYDPLQAFDNTAISDMQDNIDELFGPDISAGYVYNPYYLKWQTAANVTSLLPTLTGVDNPDGILQGLAGPLRWNLDNFGNASGKLYNNRNTFTIDAKSAPLSGSSESFSFLNKRIDNSNIEFIARVTNVQNTAGDESKAGLMIKGSDQKFIFFYVTATGKLGVQAKPGISTITLKDEDIHYAHQKSVVLKIIEKVNHVWAYYRSESSDWQLFYEGTHVIFSNYIRNFGQAVVSGDLNKFTSASFDHTQEILTPTAPSFDTEIIYPLNGTGDAYTPNSLGQLVVNSVLHGISHGIAWIPDQKGTINAAAEFHSNNANNVEVPNFSYLGSSFTITAWIRPASFSAGRKEIISGGRAEQYHGFYVYIDGSVLHADLSGVPGAQSEITIPADACNKWIHVGVIFNGNTITLFIDGIQKTSSSVAQDALVGSGPLTIGKMFQTNAGWSSYWEGGIDEVHIFNRVLAPMEMKNIAAEKYTCGLRGSYPFNGNYNNGLGTGLNIAPGTDPAFSTGINFTTDRCNHYNRAVNCSGNNWLSVSSVLDKNFSLSLWVKKNDANKRGIFSAGVLNAERGIELYADDKLRLRISGHAPEIASTSNFNTNEWVHVVITSWAGNVKLYMNGVLEGSLDDNDGNLSFGSTNVFAFGRPISIGTDGLSVWLGKLDDINLYNYELSQDEVSILYADRCPEITFDGAEYPLDGTANDISGNNLNGQLTNAAPVINRFGEEGKALQFNGGANVTVTGFPRLGNYYSLSAWVLADANSPGYSQVLQVGELDNSSGSGGALTLSRIGNTVSLFLGNRNRTREMVVENTNSFPANEWVHVAATMNNGDVKIYVNGILEHEENFSLSVDRGKLKIGANWIGRIDEVFLEGRIWTADEIKAMADDRPIEAHYLFNGNTWDEWRNYNDSVSGDPVLIEGRNSSDKAYAFHGNDYWYRNNFPTLGSQYGIVAWVKTDALQSRRSEILSLGASTDRNGLYIYLENDNIHTDLSGHFGPAAFKKLKVNTWTQIVATTSFTGDSVKLYVNGKLEGSVEMTPDIIKGRLEIGRAIYNNDNYFTGNIDEAHIYNRALTGEEIADMYKNDAPLEIKGEPTLCERQEGYYTCTALEGATYAWGFDGISEAYFSNKTVVTPIFSRPGSHTIHVTRRLNGNETSASYIVTVATSGSEVPIPLAYYPLNGDVADYSGNGLNCIDSGTADMLVPTTDRCNNPNQAYNFAEGPLTNHYLGVAAFPDLENFTISAWIMADINYPLLPIISGGLVQEAPHVYKTSSFFELYLTNKKLSGSTVRMLVRQEDGVLFSANSAYSRRIDNPDQWLHVVVTCSKSRIRIYINAQAADSNQIQLPPDWTGEIRNLRIGTGPYINTDIVFRDKIDEVKIYNTVLTDCEVVNLYSQGCTQNQSLPGPNTIMKEGKSVDEIALGNGTFKVYPNPASGLVNVAFTLEKESDVNFEITDITGRVIRKMSQKFTAGKNLTQLNVSNIAKGVYMLNIRTKFKQQTRKLMIE